jgi:transcriptional regulator GlxA family with amidase domain
MDLFNDERIIIMQIQTMSKTFDKEHRLYKKSCSYLLSNINNPHHIKALAKAVGTNHTTLSKAFNLYAGCSPMRWLKQQRLLSAKELIITTNLPIQDIALQVGYCTPSTFTISYKSIFNISPSQERNNANRITFNLLNIKN